MSEDYLAASFGEPNAQPPTPKQTPTTATFPSPIFETPKHYQGSFSEAGGLTPRFAEEYSVFNATPGNLRGTQGPFPDLISATSASSSVGHKRLLSAEGLAVEIAAHVNHFSPNPSAALPPVAPAHRLPSSPNPSAATSFNPQLSPRLSKTPTSLSKKARRGSITEEEPTQVISPPPTARKGERKLAPKVNMQNDQSFGHPDFHDPSQQEMAVLMGSATDMFGYPMSAPAVTQSNFWDPSMSVNMDLDFTASANMFQPPTPSHRHTGSFDWNSDIQLFQDTSAPPSSNQENLQPVRQERTLAPKPPASTAVCTSATDPSLSTSFAPMLDDPFNMVNSGNGVDPGLLFSRPQSASMDAEFSTMVQSGSAEAAIVQSGKAQVGDVRRSGVVRDGKKAIKGPDRATASSPVKASGRPGLGRSVSENRGRKGARRGSLPVLAPAARPASGSGITASKSTSRLPGRISPLKTQQRLSSLASIPETSPQARQRASIRFSIDAHGRATVETTMLGGGGTSMTRSQSSQDLSTRRSWSSAEDDSDTDDEPIIIPSRTSSFNASFALPDPRKPVGSIFHSSRRSVSDRSNSNSANEGESEAETVVNEKPGKVGDAASELRKVVQDRQKRSLQVGSSRSSQRTLNTNLRNFPGGIISPTSLTESSYGPDTYNVRCVCNISKADESDGFMVQW
ncbi:PHD finger domain-containing protein [Pochonia chlamydosporia 170]|uniref:PHD finger domain-containing protein n=1 Tax=Pochonia chlamydosporia 170 TaxID=1380566 RepID=A0A179FYN5_METCM|nr:PHD finger domain-containing protein [Pochonia chlamydosporia 170]OAQ70079.2 PHD finger domain-containing protein [Pochonia chlamydosporia 170]